MCVAWEEALDHLQSTPSLQELTIPLPSLPLPSFISLDPIPTPTPSTSTTTDSDLSTAEDPTNSTTSKRKAATSTTTAAAAKKVKLSAVEQVVAQEKEKRNGFMSVLKESDLKSPQLMSLDETERLILKIQKDELLAQFT